MFSLSGAVDTLTPLQVRLMLGMCKTIIGCSPFSSESCSQVFYHFACVATASGGEHTQGQVGQCCVSI